MSTDLAAILSGATAKPAAPAKPKARTYDPVDAAIRTIYGEAPPNATKEERQAIAAVIANRAAASGKNFADVVTENDGKTWQFEPWGNDKARARIEALKADSPEYKAIAADVSDILGGKANPYPGLTNFYAPDTQASLGRAKPEWDDGSGQRIGAHLFFASPGSKQPDFAGLMDTAAPALSEDEVRSAFNEAFGDPAKWSGVKPTGAGLTPYRGLENQTLPPGQQKVFEAMNKGGLYDPKAEGGTERNPYFMQEGVKEQDIAPGVFYVDREGNLKRGAGADVDGSFGKGAMQGVGDVVLSLANVMPGSDDSTLKNALIAGQRIYDASYKGDPLSGAGRFTGQVAGSVPLLAGGEAALAPFLARMGAPGAFVAGKGGLEMAPSLGRFVTRTGSLAARGAGEGVASAGLVSSASDAPIDQQLLYGGLAGGLIGPALPAAQGAGQWAGTTVRDLVQPLSPKGREEIVSRIIQNFGEGGNFTPDTTSFVPGSVPTLAQATGNPGIATLERSTRLGRPVPFNERDVANAEARASFLENVRGDQQTVADLVNVRKGIVDQARQRAFSQVADADPNVVVQAIDAALSAPQAQMEQVAKPLQAIRDKIVQPPADTTPEQLQAFNRAVAKTFGADAPALTPEVLSEAKSKLGAEFERIAKNTEVAWDDELRGTIGQIIADTAQVVPESRLPPLFKTLNDIASTSDAEMGKTISGASYQSLTKRGGAIDQLQKSSDSDIRMAANSIRDALDDGLERSVLAQGEGGAGVLNELRAARLSYKNLKTVEAALRSAGVDKQVTPEAVMSAVKRNFGNYAYQGGGPLGEVAEAALREKQARPVQMEKNPAQLYGMRESLSSAIDGLERQGTDASQLAADHLKGVRDSLDASIEKGAPAYRDFLTVAERSAEPVEAQKFLQSLRLTDAKGNVTLERVNNAVVRIEQMRAKAGKNPAKAISESTLAQLQALREDLLRADQLNRGRPLGPDTAQHIVTNNLAANMEAPVDLGMVGAGLTGHPLISAALGAGKMFYGMKNQQVLDQLATRLLQPELPAAPVSVSRKPRLPTKPVGEVLLPATAGVLVNSLTQPRGQ